MGWLKNLFFPAPAARAASQRLSQRSPKTKNGNHDPAVTVHVAVNHAAEGRDEGRTGRGGRGEGRNDSRGGRGGRGGRSDRPAGGQRDRFDADGQAPAVNTEAGMSVPAQGGQDAPKSETKQDRPARNSERGGRGERNRTERAGSGERQPASERTGARPEGRERRPDRSRRNEEGAPAGSLAQDQSLPSNDVSSKPVDTERDLGVETTSLTADTPVRADGNAPREKRSRDRYGRERGPRGERAERSEASRADDVAVDAAVTTEVAQEEPRKSYFAAPVASTAPIGAVTEAVSVEPALPMDTPTAVLETPVPVAAIVEPTPAPVAAAVIAAPATPAQVEPRGMPKLESFELPMAELADIAQSSGLNWVNSDSEKIAAVQAAIAAESKPVHVPRPRPAPVKIDTGSLVMVETKRDLREMTLPFEEKNPQ